MSTLPDNELDLEKLFLPAWAQEPPSAKHYATYEGGEDRSSKRGDRGDRRGPRPPRREGFGGPRPDRPPGERRGPRRDAPGGRKFGGRERMGDRRDAPPRERRETPPPMPEINLAFVPDDKGVESLARQVKMTGRAYPLFDIARLILQKPERHGITFSVKKKPDGQVVQPLFLCALDDTLWVSEDQAIAHVLKKHFATFYQAEKTATEPPKGKYTFVAQCGMSGVVLGPPNYHDYQNQLRKLHSERFSRMPFDDFKARVKIVRDEETVKKWIDDQSWKTEFVCLNVPEPARLNSMEAVEKHFRETHKENIIKQVESHTLSGTAARGLRSAELTWLVRQAWEDQKRFPLQLATVLSQRFASQGLQFFKVNKTITHVSVARPSFLDLETTPVSEGIKRIIEFINTHPKCTRRKMMEALTPAAAPAPATGAPAGEEETAVQAPVEPTAEQTALISDLHWLIHQGHVIEFANGVMETAKKPLPKPPKPEKKPAEPATTQAAPAENVATPEVSSAPEIASDSGSGEIPVGTAETEPPAESPSETSSEPKPEREESKTPESSEGSPS
jgi:hypothetical protein